MAWIRNRPDGLVYHDRERSAPGYALVPQGSHVSLFDAEGQEAHRWPTPAAANYARLKPDGTLMLLFSADASQPHPIANGGNDGIMELAPDGTELWRFEDPRIHHDAWWRNDGGYDVPGWEPLAAALSAQIQGGAFHPDDPQRIWGDVIFRIGRDGSRRTVWRAADHLDPATDVICPLDNRKEWTHMNSLRVTRDGHWLVSFRTTSTVALLDGSSGRVLWQWGPGHTSHQHDVRELDNGNLLLFDNGVHRSRAPAYARILEIDPATREIVWQYTDRVILAFQSFMGGGAQRLSNGNTFITEAASGRLFQVTPEGETVWEWVNPCMIE